MCHQLVNRLAGRNYNVSRAHRNGHQTWLENSLSDLVRSSFVRKNIFSHKTPIYLKKNSWTSFSFLLSKVFLKKTYFRDVPTCFFKNWKNWLNVWGKVTLKFGKMMCRWNKKHVTENKDFFVRSPQGVLRKTFGLDSHIWKVEFCEKKTTSRDVPTSL